jgi:hypothetical protein
MTKSKKDEAPGSGDIKTSGATPESLGMDQAQAKMDEEQGQGFRGAKADPTPDEHYTVQGVVENKPTPETDPALAQQTGNSRFVHLNEGEK